MKDLKNVKKWHCFFEQSGTFKNQFKKLGLDAVDYDILDEFGQTDFKVDLFAQIEKAYEGGGIHIRPNRGRGGGFRFLPMHKVLPRRAYAYAWGGVGHAQ